MGQPALARTIVCFTAAGACGSICLWRCCKRARLVSLLASLLYTVKECPTRFWHPVGKPSDAVGRDANIPPQSPIHCAQMKFGPGSLMGRAATSDILPTANACDVRACGNQCDRSMYVRRDAPRKVKNRGLSHAPRTSDGYRRKDNITYASALAMPSDELGFPIRGRTFI